MADRREELPIAVIGAGPVGLAAAAHLAERQVPFVILEAGSHPGAAVLEWAHVRLFSPWRYNIDRAARCLLEATGWSEPAGDRLPTGGELVTHYLTHLAALPAIAPTLRLNTRVEAISRVGYDRVRSAGREAAPFRLRLLHVDGSVDELLARGVIDASGTWCTPNHLGADGLPAYGEASCRDRITGCLPDVLGSDRTHFAHRHTVVVGSGHSASTTLLALAELATQARDTRVTWAIRSDSAARIFGSGTDDELPERGAIGARLRTLVDTGVVKLVPGFFTYRVNRLPTGEVELVSRDPAGRTTQLVADVVVNATGFRADHRLASELRLRLDPVLGAPGGLAPLIDPNEHSCGSVPTHGADQLAQDEPDYYVVGVKSYGRAPTFLLATGYEQVRSVVAALVGDWDAARDTAGGRPDPDLLNACTPTTACGPTSGPSCGEPASPEQLATELTITQAPPRH